MISMGPALLITTSNSRFAGPALGDDALEHGRARGAPVFDRNAGFLFKGLLYAFEDILLHGAVDDDFALFLAFSDKLGVLGENGLRKRQRKMISR